MNIIVCIKQVPGTTQVRINPETNTLIREGVEAIINPFDENAILISARQLRFRVGRAGFRDPDISYRVFFPRTLRWLRPMESRLTWLPLGAQYFVFGQK